MRNASLVRAFGLVLFGSAALSSCGVVTSDLITRADTGACRSELECPVERPRCDVGTERCVQCLQASDCQIEQVCALPAGTCVPGCQNTACPSSSPICDLTSGLCRSCTADPECPETTPRCRTDIGRCVECTVATVASDCPIIDDPLVCDEAGRCAECTASVNLCTDGETCNTTLGECGTRCSGPGVCALDEPICDATMGFCVECQTSSQCEETETCVRSECVEVQQ